MIAGSSRGKYRNYDIIWNMSDFAQRLREELEYKGLRQKELAAKAGIKKRALDMYLGSQKSMPPADVAVKLALALGVTVEYLVTGKTQQVQGVDISDYLRFRPVLDKLRVIPEEIRIPIIAMIETAAEREWEKKQRLSG
jgi:transcriptional regulator with XRE-family HTH domain